MQKPPSVAKQGLVRIPNKPCLATGLCSRQSRLPVKMTAKYLVILKISLAWQPCSFVVINPVGELSSLCSRGAVIILAESNLIKILSCGIFLSMTLEQASRRTKSGYFLAIELLQEQFFSWSWVCLLVCFRCPEPKCNSHFFTEKALDKHVNMRHKKTVQDGTGVMCDTCGKILRNQVGWEIYTFLRLSQILALRVKS